MQLALDEPELSPRELAVRFTVCVEEETRYRSHMGRAIRISAECQDSCGVRGFQEAQVGMWYDFHEIRCHLGNVK